MERDLNYRRGRGGRPWNRAKAKIKATATHCIKCGRPLFPDLTYPNRWSTSIDHIIPLSHGGDALDPNNLGAAHLFCNIREGTAIARALHPGPPTTYTDNDW